MVAPTGFRTRVLVAIAFSPTRFSSCRGVGPRQTHTTKTRSLKFSKTRPVAGSIQGDLRSHSSFSRRPIANARARRRCPVSPNTFGHARNSKRLRPGSRGPGIKVGITAGIFWETRNRTDILGASVSPPFGGFMGPQPLAGKQGSSVPVRGYGLNPVSGRAHFFAIRVATLRRVEALRPANSPWPVRRTSRAPVLLDAARVGR